VGQRIGGDLAQQVFDCPARRPTNTQAVARRIDLPWALLFGSMGASRYRQVASSSARQRADKNPHRDGAMLQWSTIVPGKTRAAVRSGHIPPAAHGNRTNARARRAGVPRAKMPVPTAEIVIPAQTRVGRPAISANARAALGAVDPLIRRNPAHSPQGKSRTAQWFYLPASHKHTLMGSLCNCGSCLRIDKLRNSVGAAATAGIRSLGAIQS